MTFLIAMFESTKLHWNDHFRQFYQTYGPAVTRVFSTILITMMFYLAHTPIQLGMFAQGRSHGSQKF
ncbi:unnamed protein product [Medioppia subpectinata]|uniref:Uncharacterized protein n=1 Tax=Medioppia subpectinata TaxID=1979941 RepID=A0A7R9LC39_9ACAR|nr:unnamed protein product [Medioppia subpectinata]CAG2117643.1 unnamed protein product [Medioppia subpectinata]